jgi:hypothetical protein
MGSINLMEMHQKDMHWWWESPSTLPTLAGTYRSPMATILRDLRTARILRESLEICAYQAARPFHVIESHPPKSNTGDDELTTLEAFGERVAGSVSQKIENMRQNKMRVKTSELVSAIHRAHSANVNGGAGGSHYDRTEGGKESFERENTGFLTRLMPLPPDKTYKSAAAPHLLGDLDQVEKRIDSSISAIMDFPRELLQPQSSVRGTNLQGNLRFWNERQKYWMAEFARAYKHTLLQIYGNVLQLGIDELSKRKRSYAFDRQQAIFASDDLHVEFSCSPIATFEDLHALHQFGIIKKETVGAYMLSQFGIPGYDLHVTKEPDMMPTIAEVEKAKGAARASKIQKIK